jgi:precorrin-8X/cobalt-precorrin-8 methylmutase
MSSGYDYIRDGNAIYEKSFAIIRAETDLSRFSRLEADIVVRMVHAAGLTETAQFVHFSNGAAEAGRAALQAGAPVFCDAKMVANGVTKARLSAKNDVICTLDDTQTPSLAKAINNTRSAGAMELWRERLGGSVVVIGNAPTALFRLLELLDEGTPKPAMVIGCPVGFVGAAESKDALFADGRVPCMIVKGRRGGSAMAAAAVNALARDEI